MRLHILILLSSFAIAWAQREPLSISTCITTETIIVTEASLSVETFAGELNRQKISNLISFIDTLSNDSLRREALLLFRKSLSPDFIPLLDAYKSGTLYATNDQLIIYSPQKNDDGTINYTVTDAITGDKLKNQTGHDSTTLATAGTALKVARNDRKLISDITISLSFTHQNKDIQKENFIKAADAGDVLYLQELLRASSSCHPENNTYFKESVARLQLLHGNNEDKLVAITTLGQIGTIRAISSLEKIAQQDSMPGNLNSNQLLRNSVLENLKRANTYQIMIGFIKSSFSGLSLGSILIFLALGLSVIFGLMGVINMAHGEFMMVGAFTTYVICEFFKANISPHYFDLYYIVAIPAAFTVSFLIGWLCESLLIRKLYGRPFETILATWGLSLILIQLVRIVFGDTLSLTPPGWLSGGWEIMPDLILPTNRIFIIIYCAVCILGFYILINKTRLGLLLRASTQDRQTASSLGVSVRKVDGIAFALGAGLAGLAGAAVPLFDKINPGMGQGYIVDSFMVVVVGGVGNLGGCIFGGLGLGFITKYIEPFLGAVYGKVTVLILIVLFLQSRPSGLFPSKGRSADD